LGGSLRKNKSIHVLITDNDDPKLYFSQDEVSEKVSVSTEDKNKDQKSS
jgi:hypothetical protein